MKKKTKAIIALAVGIVTLSTAAFASYTSSNGYDVLKKAVIDTLDTPNYTLKYDVSLKADDKVLFTDSGYEQFDKTSGALYIEDKGNDNSRDIECVIANEPYEYTSYMDIEDNKIKFTKYPIGEWGIQNTLSIDKNDKTVAKYIRFGELFVDTFVGDLKNNFILTSQTDDEKTYQITLSSVQVPEIVNAGFGVIYANVMEYIDEEHMTDEEKAVKQMGENPTVKNASLKFVVDKNNKITDAKIVGVLEGNGHTMTLEVNANLTDIGTTVPQEISEEDRKNAYDVSVDYGDMEVEYTEEVTEEE